MVQDALRKDDQRVVMLKNVDPNEYPTECGIANYFSSKELADIPENHCVPIYEALQAPGEDTIVLVMPLLRKCMDPPFETVGEVIDFLGQVFEVRPLLLPSHGSSRGGADRVYVSCINTESPIGMYSISFSTAALTHPFPIVIVMRPIL